jgi:hypothetical protein
MPAARPRSFGLDLVIRALRFFYLLWGGMILATLASSGRLRLPQPIWKWPTLAQFLLGPWGRGLALGLGIVMSLAALIEVWELVDRLLIRFLNHSDR